MCGGKTMKIYAIRKKVFLTNPNFFLRNIASGKYYMFLSFCPNRLTFKFQAFLTYTVDCQSCLRERLIGKTPF